MKKLLFMLLLVYLITVIGCAQGGSCEAIGQDAKCIGGPADFRLNVSPSIALGSDVAEAASKAAEAYLKTLSLPISALTDSQITNAVDAGMEEGLETAARKGKTITNSNRQELRREIKTAVENKIPNP